MRFSDLGWNPNQFDHSGEWCPVRLGMIPVLRTTLWMFFHDLYVQNMQRIYYVCIVYVTYIYIYQYIYVHICTQSWYIVCMLHAAHPPAVSLHAKESNGLGLCSWFLTCRRRDSKAGWGLGAGMPEKHMMTQWDITDITMDKMWNEYHQIMKAPWSDPSLSLGPVEIIDVVYVEGGSQCCCLQAGPMRFSTACDICSLSWFKPKFPELSALHILLVLLVVFLCVLALPLFCS